MQNDTKGQVELWQACGRSPEGLVQLNGWGREGILTARMEAVIIGGICLPNIRLLGGRMFIGGGGVVLAVEPAKGDRTARATIIHRWFATTNRVELDVEGWPMQQVTTIGSLRDAATRFYCRRWGCYLDEDTCRETRRELRGDPADDVWSLNIVPMGNDSQAHERARKRVFLWASAGRIEIGQDALRVIEEEEQEMGGQGPSALTSSLGAALELYDQRPYRKPEDTPWRRIKQTVIQG